MGNDDGARPATYDEYLADKEKRETVGVEHIKEELEKVRDQLALEKSIAKWSDILNGTGADHGSANCSLCTRHKNTAGCHGCVVFKKVGEWGCRCTPYVEWTTHHAEKHGGNQVTTDGRKIECGECIIIAVREVNFLKSLRFKGYITPTRQRQHGAIRRTHFDFAGHSPYHT